MSTFKYKARKLSGEIETGTMESQNQDSLISALQDKGLIVINVSRTEKKKDSQGAYSLKLHKRIKSKDLIFFATQLATTLEASIPLLKCLEIQIEQTSSIQLRTTLENITDNVRSGHSFKDSIAKYPKVFSSMWLHLIETGETSGELPAVLHQLTTYLVAKEDLKQKTITALIYPSAIVVVGTFAVYIFTIKIIPVFASIFLSMNIELPLITKVIITISDFLKSHVFSTFLGVGGSIFLLRRYSKTEKGRKYFDKMFFRLPIFGPFFINSAIEKFSSTLGILLKSGIPILQALEVIAKISNNTLIEDALMKAKSDVRDGRTLSGSLSQSKIFPPLAISMCSIGEETGQLSGMLEKLTQYYREELTTFAERLSATIEPIIIIIVGIFVAFLVFALYIPIFKITTLGG